MTYFLDLSLYQYNHWSSRPGTLSVGWLDRRHRFDVATPSPAFLERLWSFCKVSVVQMRGLHDCEFCFDDSQFVRRGDETLMLGSAEIRAFGPGRLAFAAPTLIYHYVERHNYAPPDLFVDAIMDGPAPDDPAYFSRLEALGLEWGYTSSPSERPRRIRLDEKD